MNATKARWQAWNAKFAAMTPREKLIVAAAVIAGGAMVGFNFGIEPFLVKAKAANAIVQRTQGEIPALQAQLTVLNSQNADPDAPLRARLEATRKQIAGAGERLARFEAGMVPPERMQGFLETLLSKHRNLELLELRTLPVAPVGVKAAEEKKPEPAPAAGTVPSQPAPAVPPAPTSATEGKDAGIFQHGVEIRLAGSYNDLLNYLAELERMPQRVMWSRVSVSVERYPRNVMLLRVYTLSLDKNWLVMS